MLWLFYVAYVGFRNIESWKFLFKGRQMIRERARSVSSSLRFYYMETSINSHKSGEAPFSMPIFGYGGRMHIVSTAQHWGDLKNAHIGHLSLHHWVKDVS